MQSLFLILHLNIKKDLQFSDIPVLKKVGYVEIEDFLKKGIDEFKKILMEKENEISETKTIFEDNSIGPFEFQIVKFEKSLKPEDYLETFGKQPKIISSILIEKMESKSIQFIKKNVGLGHIIRYLNKVYIPLSEGDVINIKTKYTFVEDDYPLNRGDNKRFFRHKFNNFITGGLNFNFTFLIELDPL